MGRGRVQQHAPHTFKLDELFGHTVNQGCDMPLPLAFKHVN